MPILALERAAEFARERRALRRSAGVLAVASMLMSGPLLVDEIDIRYEKGLTYTLELRWASAASMQVGVGTFLALGGLAGAAYLTSKKAEEESGEWVKDLMHESRIMEHDPLELAEGALVIKQAEQDENVACA